MRRSFVCKRCRHWQLVETDDSCGTFVFPCDNCDATLLGQVKATSAEAPKERKLDE